MAALPRSLRSNRPWPACSRGAPTHATVYGGILRRALRQAVISLQLFEKTLTESNSKPADLQAPGQLFPVTRYFSYWLTPLLLRYPITPNQVTVASLTCGLGGAACFIAGNYLWNLVGGLLLVLCYTLDNCDGEIARIKKLSTPIGAVLDDIVDWLVDSVFFLCLGIGVASACGESLWFWLGALAAVGATIDYVIDLVKHAQAKRDPAARSRVEQASDPKRPARLLDWLIYVFHKLSRADFCLIVLLLALGEWLWILLPAAAIGAQAYWIADLFERARGYHV
jgi:phosphatidylglycerophosphate synthase